MDLTLTWFMTSTVGGIPSIHLAVHYLHVISGGLLVKHTDLIL